MERKQQPPNALTTKRIPCELKSDVFSSFVRQKSSRSRIEKKKQKNVEKIEGKKLCGIYHMAECNLLRQ